MSANVSARYNADVDIIKINYSIECVFAPDTACGIAVELIKSLACRNSKSKSGLSNALTDSYGRVCNSYAPCNKLVGNYGLDASCGMNYTLKIGTCI